MFKLICNQIKLRVQILLNDVFFNLNNKDVKKKMLDCAIWLHMIKC